MATQKKIDTVTKLKEKLTRSTSIFITDYRGMSHPQLELLRKALKKVEAEFVVAKNTLLKRALEGNKTMKRLEEELKNPTAVLFVYGDELAAIKALAKFIKSVQLPKIKIGLFGGKVATSEDFAKLASLPERKVLLAILLSRLQSPIAGFCYGLNWNIQRIVIGLNNIKKQK